MSKKKFTQFLCLCPLMGIFLTGCLQSKPVQLHSDFAPGKKDLADLTVTRVYFTPAKPTIKDKVTINVEIKNIGSGPAYFSPGMTAWETTQAPTANASMGIRTQSMGVQNDEVLGGKIETPQAIVLKPGESYVSSLAVVNSGRLAPGEYPYSVKVNPDGRIEEADKTNNEQKGALKLKSVAGR
jgi:hypothetical protein